MTLWLLGGLLTLIVVVMLAVPLMKPRGGGGARGGSDIEVYKDQLAEIERDAARGLLGPAEAEAVRIEVQRRILAAAKAEPPVNAAAARPDLALALVVALPFLAGALYLAIGRPDLPGQSAAEDAPPRDPAVAKRLAELEARARANPTSVADRLAVADYEFENRRFRSAAGSYRRALELSNGRGDIASLYGEALTRAAGGFVTEEARIAFARALAENPKDPRAQFFVGLADAQAGNARAALVRWLRLEAEAPPGASWVPVIRSEMERVAREAEIDLAALRHELKVGEAAPPATRGPSPRDIEEAEKLSPEQRKAMIRGMVEGLEARLKENPNDLEGWKRLGRAWSVLEEHAKAAEALRRAHALAPDDVQVMSDLASAIIRMQPKGKEVTPEAVEILTKLLARDADNALALFYLGLAAAEAGKKVEAAAHWKKLLDRLPADAPVRDIVKRRLAALGVDEKK